METSLAEYYSVLSTKYWVVSAYCISREASLVKHSISGRGVYRASLFWDLASGTGESNNRGWATLLSYRVRSTEYGVRSTRVYKLQY